MNNLLTEIARIIRENIALHLPSVSPSDLEGEGEIYFMNGKNGTEFDWHVNEHLPPFMVFYNDEANLGAVKAMLYTDGVLEMCLYDDHGKHLAQIVKTDLKVPEEELLRLATCLRINADDKKIWDDSIIRIDTDELPDEQEVSGFLAHREYCEPSIRRKAILVKLAVVSKRITEDGCKVGFMACDDPGDDEDSGWFFSSGDEDDDYAKDINNLVLIPVGAVVQMDPSILPYIDSPAGSAFERGEDDGFVQVDYKE